MLCRPSCGRRDTTLGHAVRNVNSIICHLTLLLLTLPSVLGMGHWGKPIRNYAATFIQGDTRQSFVRLNLRSNKGPRSSSASEQTDAADNSLASSFDVTACHYDCELDRRVDLGHCSAYKRTDAHLSAELLREFEPPLGHCPTVRFQTVEERFKCFAFELPFSSFPPPTPNGSWR